MSTTFRTSDFQIADKAARALPTLIAGDMKPFIMQLILVPALIYFMTHIAEHRRAVRVSSMFFLNAVKKEIDECCARNNLSEEAAKEMHDIVIAEAHKLWKPRERSKLYPTPKAVLEDLIAFLKKH